MSITSVYGGQSIVQQIRKLRAGVDIVVGTPGRVIDHINLTHVINYSLPNDTDPCIHRIGRAGRAGNVGVAITFVTPVEYRKLQFLKRIVKSNIRKERLPPIDDLIQAKRDRIVSEVEEIAKNGEKIRLFIQMGRKDGLTKRKLVNLLERKSSVSEALIRDAQPYDIYSFVTVPYLYGGDYCQGL